MKALTITQPWATLIAHGAKNFETRGWATAYRGPLAIHAGKNLAPIGGEGGLREICEGEPFRAFLTGLGFADPRDLPRGMILCTTELLDCIPTERLAPPGAMLRAGGAGRELDFGNYAPGRFAFRLGARAAMLPPRPATGRQQLWEWEQ